MTVAPIPDRAGYLLRQALLDRLQPGDQPRYRLEITLDDRLTGFGIQPNATITRECRTLRARYRLIEIATSAIVLDATAADDEGIDVVRDEYAVVAAEETAQERLATGLADQITARVALYARQATRLAPETEAPVPPNAPPPPNPGDTPPPRPFGEPPR